MEKNSTSIVITTLIFTLSLFLLTQTKAHSNPKHKSSQPPTHAPTHAHKNPKSSQSPSPTNSPNIPTSKPKSPPSPTNSPNIPKSKPKSPPSPANIPKSKPKSPPSPTNIPKTKPKSPPSPTIKKNDTSPYHFVNQFCLSRRLDVQSTFCLEVLRSNPTSSKAQSNNDLLLIAANNAIDFGNKTLLILNKLSKDKTTPNPVIEECLSAYKGYISQYNVLKQEAKSETRMASYDAELAKNELNRCVKAVNGKKTNAEIREKNEIALNYAKLTLNIADSTH